MNQKAFLEVNLDAIASNFQAIQENLNSEDFLCPMIKDNAYGHGLVPVGQALESVGAKNLGVFQVEEGLSLRKSGVKSKILIFGDYDLGASEVMLEHHLTPVVSSWRQVEVLIKMNRQFKFKNSKTQIPIHIKFDTGMSRLGFSEREVSKVENFLIENKRFLFEGLLTHLVSAEDSLSLDSRTQAQLESLRKVVLKMKIKPHVIHSLNSAAILSKVKSRSHSYLNQSKWGLRPGLMIYGLNPLKGKSPFPLVEAMSLRSKPLLIRKVKKGSTVSYAGTWTAPQDSYIAVLPIGYGVGFARALSNQCFGICEGLVCPQVGNICMDLTMFDVTPLIKKYTIDQLYEKEITLLGNDAHGNKISASTLAKTIGTIPWEILVRFQERLPRIYLKASSKSLHSNE